MAKVQVNTSNTYQDSGEGLSRRTIAKASDGRLWVLYAGNEGISTNDLYVAYSTDNGASWTEEVAVTNDRPRLTNPFPMLLIDSSDVPIIIYEKDVVGSDDELRYADRSGGTWQTPEVIRVNLNIQEVDAVMDSSDVIHIAYTRVGVQYIKGSTGSLSAIHHSASYDKE